MGNKKELIGRLRASKMNAFAKPKRAVVHATLYVNVKAVKAVNPADVEARRSAQGFQDERIHQAEESGGARSPSCQRQGGQGGEPDRRRSSALGARAVDARQQEAAHRSAQGFQDERIRQAHTVM